MEFVIIILFSYIVNSADHSLNNNSFKGSISCGEIRSESLSKPNVYYSFSILETQDITFSLCDSPYLFAFRSRIDLYDHQYQRKIQCYDHQSATITTTCNVCLIGSDIKSSMNSITLNALSPGNYYIQVANMNSYYINNHTFKYPVYTLKMSCTNISTSFAPSSSKTTRKPSIVSNDNVSDDSGLSAFAIMCAVIVTVIVIIFIATVCLFYFCSSDWNKQKLRNSDEYDGDTLPSENIPIPSAPIIDENVSLMVNVSNDSYRPEGCEGNIDTGGVIDIQSFFYNKVNIDGYNDIYIELFIENGFGSLDVLKNLSDDELKVIGVDKLDHRQKIMNEISKIIDILYAKN